MSTPARKAPLAWMQLAADPMRLCAAVAGIAFAVILMLMQLGFRDALYTASVLMQTNLDCDLVMIGRQYQYLAASAPFSHRRLQQTLADPSVESVTRCYAAVGSWKNPVTRADNPILVLGFEPNRPVFRFTETDHPLEIIRLDKAILFDSASKPVYGPIADLLRERSPVAAELSGRRVNISGLFKMGASFIADGNAIMSDSNFLRLFPYRRSGVIDVGAINLKPGANLEATRARLESVSTSDVRVLTRKQFIALEKSYWAVKSPIGFIFNMGVLVGFIVGTVIVYQILYTDVMNHLAEYATLKAMGYKDSALSYVVSQQALILAILGFVPGALFSTGLYIVTEKITRLPTYMTTGRAVLVLLLTVAMCLGSGALAMRKLKKADPADIF